MKNFKTAEQEQFVPLNLITVSHNPRKPLKKLQSLGFDPMKFCHEFGLSDDPAKKKHFVDTLKENHPEIELMAKSIDNRSQIQPIILRRIKEGTSYGIACGERRFITCVFLQAESGEPFPVKAVIKRLTVEEAFWLGVDENLQREDMTEVEKGEIFAKFAEEHTLCQGVIEKKDSERDSDLPLTAVAEHFHVPYHYARGRAALARDLKPERLKLYEDGKLKLTDAIREALGDLKEGAAKKTTRQSAMTLKEIRDLFDKTPVENVERLKTLAEVMKISLDEAIKESNLRLS